MSNIALSENEKKVLSYLVSVGEAVSTSEISSAINVPESTIYAVIELLKSKGLVREETSLETVYMLTDEGEKVLKLGFPEEVLVPIALQTREIPIKELENRIGTKQLSIALATAKRRGLVDIKGGKAYFDTSKISEIQLDKDILEKLSKGDKKLSPSEIERLETLQKRGLIEKKINKILKLKAEVPIAREVLKREQETVSKLRTELIVSGKWKEIILKEYNVEAQPPAVYPGLKHFYLEFIRKIKRILIGMGFTEVNGPFIEQEFWNFDVLFQAQDHPSREVHDTFWIDFEVKDLNAPEEVVKRAKAVHENGGETGSTGWRYSWSEDIARRLILRTHMTAVSARMLSKRPVPPFRYFTIGKVFRPDVIDSRHLPEFIQLDAIISQKDMSFSMLLGTIKLFFEKMGLSEVLFKPAYFPFTEPSVEGYVKIPGQGYVEVFGAGMFRPEVLEIAGIKDPVGAWGIGLDRLAMSLLNVEDIRELYGRDVEKLRENYVKAIKYNKLNAR